MMINSTWDVAVARNTCRKLILGEKLPPSLCACAVAAIAVFGEFILQTHATGSLEVKVIPQQGKSGVDLICSIALNAGQPLSLDALRQQLTRVTSTFDIYNQGHQLEITAHF